VNHYAKLFFITLFVGNISFSMDMQLQCASAKNISTAPVPYAQDMCYVPRNISTSFAMCPKKTDDAYFELSVAKKQGFACLVDDAYKDGERLVIPGKCIKNILKKYANIDIDTEWKNLIANHIYRKGRWWHPVPPKQFQDKVEELTEKIDNWFKQASHDAKSSLYDNEDVRDFLKHIVYDEKYHKGIAGKSEDWEGGWVSSQYDLWSVISDTIQGHLRNKRCQWSKVYEQDQLNIEVHKVSRDIYKWQERHYIANDISHIIENKDVFDMYQGSVMRRTLFHVFIEQHRFDEIPKLIAMYLPKKEHELKEDVNVRYYYTPLTRLFNNVDPDPAAVRCMKAMIAAGGDITVDFFHSGTFQRFAWLPYIAEEYKKLGKESDLIKLLYERKRLWQAPFLVEEYIATGKQKEFMSLVDEDKSFLLFNCLYYDGSEKSLDMLRNLGVDFTIKNVAGLNVFQFAALVNPKAFPHIINRYPDEYLARALNEELRLHHTFHTSHTFFPLLTFIVSDASMDLSDESFLEICIAMINARADITKMSVDVPDRFLREARENNKKWGNKIGEDFFTKVRNRRPGIIPQLIKTLMTDRVAEIIQKKDALLSLALADISDVEFVAGFSALLEAGKVDITQLNGEKKNVLHLLATNKPTVLPHVIFALEEKAKQALNTKDYYGYTPLLRLGEEQCGRIPDKLFRIIFEVMVDAGADVTKIKPGGKSAPWPNVFIIMNKKNRSLAAELVRLVLKKRGIKIPDIGERDWITSLFMYSYCLDDTPDKDFIREIVGDPWIPKKRDIFTNFLICTLNRWMGYFDVVE